ncbi:hypothetical protein [Pseudomonas bharatica]|uniref:hypothetical protein n=1 Tax=Pseudomonas bharatica TaxID=2692112 RepID=UPI0040691E61
MFERLIRFAIEQRIVVMIAVLLMAGLGIYSYQKLPHRRGAGYHQRPGADQHRSPGLLAPGNRAAHHLRGGNRHGRPARAQANALAVALGAVQVTVIFADGTDIFFARSRSTNACRSPGSNCPTAWKR